MLNSCCSLIPVNHQYDTLMSSYSSQTTHKVVNQSSLKCGLRFYFPSTWMRMAIGRQGRAGWQSDATDIQFADPACKYIDG